MHTSKNVLIGLIWIVIFSLFLVSLSDVSASPTDGSVGSFQHDLDNDAPEIQDWYVPTTTITPLQDILLWVVVQDIDNTSAHLTVTAYYSNDSFVADNNSMALSFYQNENSNNTYRFVEWFTGQADGVEYDFYYTVYDGESTVRRPAAPNYVTVQWVDTTITTVPFDGSNRFQIIPVLGDIIENAPLILFASITFVMLVGAIVVNVNTRTTQRVELPKGAGVTRVSYEYGKFYLSQSMRLLNGGLQQFFKRGTVAGKRGGKNILLTAHSTLITRDGTKTVGIRGTQDKIVLEPMSHPQTTRERLKNIVTGVVADARYLFASIKFQFPKYYARLAGKPAPELPKREPYTFKNPFSVYYRKARSKVKNTERNIYAAQAKMPSTVERATDTRRVDRKLMGVQKDIPKTINKKSKRHLGFLHKAGRRAANFERKVGRYASGKKTTKKGNGRFRRPQ